MIKKESKKIYSWKYLANILNLSLTFALRFQQIELKKSFFW